MAAVLKRLVILGIALAFLAGTWSSPLYCAMAQAQAGTAAHSVQPKMPPSDCAGHPGCIAAPTVPALPPVLGLALRWTQPVYDFAGQRLAGRSVEPDLFPPILAS